MNQLELLLSTHVKAPHVHGACVCVCACAIVHVFVDFLSASIDHKRKTKIVDDEADDDDGRLVPEI